MIEKRAFGLARVGQACICDIPIAQDPPAPVGAAALIGASRRWRNALGAHAFGRRPVSNSEIHSAFALAAMRNTARPGGVVA